MRLFLITIFSLCLIILGHSAETINDGEHVFIFDDGLLAALAKDSGKELRDHFKKRGIKWTCKSEKSGGFKSALDNIDKVVLKKKPQIVVLSFGLYSIYDPKKKQVTEHDLSEIEASIDALHEKVSNAGARFVMITPGLCTEDLTSPQHSAMKALVQMMLANAEKHNYAICDLHSSSEAWLQANPPKKKGRNQLTKDGIKWDKDGEALMKPKFMKILGLSGGSSINRAIRWDETVVIHTIPDSWVISFPGGAKMEDRLSTLLKSKGPQAAPAGFKKPGVQGPKAVLGRFKGYPNDYDIKSLQSHNPTVAFVYPMYEYATRYKTQASKDSSKLDEYIENMMKAFAKEDYPIYVMTHLWGIENGEKKLSKGPRYKRCKEVSALINKYGDKHNVEVIDLFAQCEQIHQTNDVVIFGKEFQPNQSNNVYPSQAGIRLMYDAILEKLGLSEEK